MCTYDGCGCADKGICRDRKGTGRDCQKGAPHKSHRNSRHREAVVRHGIAVLLAVIFAAAVLTGGSSFAVGRIMGSVGAGRILDPSARSAVEEPS